MKILMILSNPFIVDPRVYKEAKTLVETGYQVTVIVWDRHGEYEAESMIEGIKIIRIRNEGLMKLIPSDLFRNPFWWREAYKKALETYEKGYRFDVVHCHDLDTLQTGVWLKKRLRVKLIYDAHEIFGYMVSRNMPKVVSKAAFWMEKNLIKYADHIITVNEPLRDYFKSIIDKPITIVMNCKDLIGKEYIPSNNDVFTISYIGVLHKNRMFPELVDVIGEIEDVKFVIAGKKENLYDEVEERCREYKNIEFLGTIPFTEVIPKTLESDVIIHMVNPLDINNRIGLGNKQFEAMVCGRPIICTKGTFAGELTEREKVGLVVDYNKDAVREAIIKLRDNQDLREELGRNALRAAIKKYNWEKQKIKLLDVYKDLEDLDG